MASSPPKPLAPIVPEVEVGAICPMGIKGMPIINRKQRLSEAREIMRLTGNDLDELDSVSNDRVRDLSEVIIRQVVTGTVVTDYTLIDEILAEIIVRYFFGSKKLHVGPQWRLKKYRIFVHHMLDETYLLKKMSIVNAIGRMPAEIRSSIHRVNTLRNAVAHAFFPENRKEYRKVRKLLYLKKNVFSSRGFKVYHEDSSKLIDYLQRRLARTRSPH
jgi:hypothetical protein